MNTSLIVENLPERFHFHESLFKLSPSVTYEIYLVPDGKWYKRRKIKSVKDISVRLLSSFENENKSFHIIIYAYDRITQKHSLVDIFYNAPFEARCNEMRSHAKYLLPLEMTQQPDFAKDGHFDSETCITISLIRGNETAYFVFQ